MNSLSSSAHETMHLSDSLANVFGHSGGYLRIEWQTVPMNSGEVRRLFDQILLLLREQRLHRLFTERTMSPPLSAEDCHWMALEWLPRATREAGLTHCAVVESTEQVEARNAPFIDRSEPAGRLQIRFFDSFTQAEAWIREAA